MRLVNDVKIVPCAKPKKPPKTSAVSGFYQLKGHGRQVAFQSSIERDFVTICDFAPEVETIRWQPFSISFADLVSETERTYTPDYLVETTARSGERYTYLVEVKRYDEHARYYEADPVGEPARAHMAAVEWARSQPMAEMVVITDRWLTSRGIGNVKRINSSALYEVQEELQQIILSAVLTMSGVSIGSLATLALPYGYERAQVTSSVLRLCYDDLCHFDIREGFDLETMIHEGSRSRIFRF